MEVPPNSFEKERGSTPTTCEGGTLGGVRGKVGQSERSRRVTSSRAGREGEVVFNPVIVTREEVSRSNGSPT